MSRRAQDEGSIYRRTRDNKWVAAVTIGHKPDGKPIKRERIAKTKAEAARKLRALHQKFLGGEKGPLEIQTVDDLVRAFSLQHCAGLDENAQEEYNRYANKIQPYVGHVPLTTLDGPQLARLFVDLERDGVSRRIRARVHSLLRRALEYAIHLELITKSPLYLIKAPPVGEPQKERDRWSDKEVHTFLNHPKVVNHRLFALFFLMLARGLRVGEAAGLQWQDLHGNVLHINRTVRRRRVDFDANKLPKGGKKRPLRLTEDDLEELRKHKARLEEDFAVTGVENPVWMFPSTKGGPVYYESVRQTLKGLARAAGVRNLRPHGTRRTWRSLNKHAKVDSVLLAKQAGHSVAVGDSDTYTIIDDEWEAEGVLSLNELLQGRCVDAGWAEDMLQRIKVLLLILERVAHSEQPDAAGLEGLIKNFAEDVRRLVTEHLKTR